jgi:small subunit ribosomal protein S15
MSITQEQTKYIVEQFAISDLDTGSAEVQVALLTARINAITAHVKQHKKDFSSKRGLLILVGQRRRLLNYLKKTSVARYQTLIGKLNLRK